VTTCVLNQFKSRWLFSKALQSAITMCLKFRGKITNPIALVNLIDDDFWITFELFLFTFNIKRKVCRVLDSFLSF
jgi:hypothetical protein